MILAIIFYLWFAISLTASCIIFCGCALSAFSEATKIFTDNPFSRPVGTIERDGGEKERLEEPAAEFHAVH
jgi:hypothetical protein